MDEKDLQLARAMVEEEKDQNDSPGGSSANSTKKTVLNRAADKMNAFR